MVGLDIRVKNEYSNYLYKIFDRINLLNYMWKINTDDFLYLEGENISQDFFKANILSGGEFLKSISRDSYYMIFADIKAYPMDNDYDEVKNFKDFLESNCKLILLCSDSTFIEFYSKDKDILEKVYCNCIKYSFEDVRYVTFEHALARDLIV